MSATSHGWAIGAAVVHNGFAVVAQVHSLALCRCRSWARVMPTSVVVGRGLRGSDVASRWCQQQQSQK